MPPEPSGPKLPISPFFSTAEDPRSPQPPNPSWRGLLLSAPPQAVLSLRQPMVLVHGSYRIQGDAYPADDRLRLVAVDTATGVEYAGEAGERDPSPTLPPPEPEEPVEPEVFKRMIFSGFFNADLMATARLPWKSGTYKVRAELGRIRSNENTLQIVVQ